MFCLPKKAGRTEFRSILFKQKASFACKNAPAFNAKWIESQDTFRLYPSAFNPKDYQIPMETVYQVIILRVLASRTAALMHGHSFHSVIITCVHDLRNTSNRHHPKLFFILAQLPHPFVFQSERRAFMFRLRFGSEADASVWTSRCIWSLRCSLTLLKFVKLNHCQSKITESHHNVCLECFSFRFEKERQ